MCPGQAPGGRRSEGNEDGKDPAEVIYDMAYCVAASTVLTPLRDSIVGPYKPPPEK